MDDISNVVRVYLAGGFRSDWHKLIEGGVGGAYSLFQFYNPKNKKLERPEEYWSWDLAAIRKSDVVFVYFESWMKEKPGAGVIAEFGYAVGQNKLVILVNEVNHRYYTQLKHWPNVVYFEELKGGIDFLMECRWLR